MAVTAALVALLTPPSAFAHRFGLPVPDVQVLTQPTEQVTWLLSIRLLDQDSREPVRKAVVRVTPVMAEPHRMVLPSVVLEESPYVPGLYSGPVTFLHPARWALDVDVSGPVVRVRKTLELEVTAARGAEGRAQVVATTVAVRLGAREWVNLAVLAVHLIVGVAWVGALGVAGFAPRMASGIPLRRLAAASWLAAAVMIATGLYNSAYNMPVHVDWFSGGLGPHLAAFARVPFGTGYGIVLLAKHALTAAMLAMLVALTVVARRPGTQSSPAARVLLRLASLIGALVLVQSVGLGYLHRLIAHF